LHNSISDYNFCECGTGVGEVESPKREKLALSEDRNLTCSSM